MNLIEQVEKELGKQKPPTCQVGDTVEVHYLIREGEKERVQLFIGLVIAMKGRGIRRSITVRRIVQGEGVERIFPLHNPRVKDVVTTRKGETRRAKLYYLRDRVGKSTRLKEVLRAKAVPADSDSDGTPAPAPIPSDARRVPEAAGAR